MAEDIAKVYGPRPIPQSVITVLNSSCPSLSFEHSGDSVLVKEIR
jgi:hypothetical protein